MKPPAGTVVPGGMIYFFGLSKLSVRNHPPIFAVEADVLNNSIASPATGSSLASTSFTTTAGNTIADGSFVPGEPPRRALGRQLVALFHAPGAAFSFAVTSEKPPPS